VFSLAAGVLVSGSIPQAAEPVSLLEKVAFRRPAGIVVSPEGTRVLTANRRTGTISVVNPVTRKVVSETAVGTSLSSLVWIPRTRLLLTTDEATHELILLSRDADRVQVVTRLPVSPCPVSVAVQADGRRCYVASLWSRKLTVVDIATKPNEKSPQLGEARVIPLPFAPRLQTLVDSETRLVVADSFGGKLAVLDTRRNEIVSVREMPAHNIRGMALNADGTRLLVAHQILNSLAKTTPDDVHWGMLVSNVVRALDLESVRSTDAKLLDNCEVHPIGDAWLGGSDPGSVVLLPDGRVVVAISGMGTIGLLGEYDSRVQRIATVARPTEVVVSPDAGRIYTIDELADEIGVIDTGEPGQIGVVPLGRQPEWSQAERGERLFYDGELSHGGWMSCHSCHTDGHSNGFLNDNLGDDSFGAPKRVLSLLGAGRTAPWAWNGGARELETQIKKSIEMTMRGRHAQPEQIKAIGAFVRTLPAPPTIAPADPAAVARGKVVFAAQDCTRCHAPPDYTTPATYDVGLRDELDNTRFNPPSLRGVVHRDLLFHDNRAKSLEEVFSKFQHKLDHELPAIDLADLVAFLRSL
jgi:YVTN family beta-propeller protein